MQMDTTTETTSTTDNEFIVENQEGLSFLDTINNNSINLILTDPPYIISRDTGMDKHHKMVEETRPEFMPPIIPIKT